MILFPFLFTHPVLPTFEDCLQECPSVYLDAYRRQSGKGRATRARSFDPALLIHQATGHVESLIPEKGHGFLTCVESQSDVWFPHEDALCDKKNSR